MTVEQFYALDEYQQHATLTAWLKPLPAEQGAGCTRDDRNCPLVHFLLSLDPTQKYWVEGKFTRIGEKEVSHSDFLQYFVMQVDALTLGYSIVTVADIRKLLKKIKPYPMAEKTSDYE